MLTLVNSPSAVSVPITATARIADNLALLEASLDQAMAAAASLTQAMIDARRDSGVPVHTGQIALIRLQRAQAQLVAASSDTFRVHDELARIAKTLMVMDDPTKASGLSPDDGLLEQVA